MYHRLWAAEAGTGMNDGRVSLIASSGNVYTVIEGFVSAVDPEGNSAGLNHLLYDNGTLWILHGIEGRLYKADVADFVPGLTPTLQASELEYQEIGSYVLGQRFVESNLYKFTKGPHSGLSFASDMELSWPRTAYVTNIAEGKVMGVVY